MANGILSTTNYDMFTFYEKNRIISNRKIQDIANAIAKLDLTQEKPILVNEKFQIVDGQHRFMACKKLKRPIYYIKKTLNGQMDNATILLNANQGEWSLSDYIDHYVKRGHKDCQLILDCVEKYKVTRSVAVSFVSNSPNSESGNIKAGKFKRGKIDYSVYGDILMDFKEIFKEYNHIFFIRALIVLISSGKYDHKADFKKFVKNRYDMRGCANLQQYFKMFEDILNRHRRGGKIKLES